MAGDRLGGQSLDVREGGNAFGRRRCCEQDSGWKPGEGVPIGYVRRVLDGTVTVADSRSRKETVAVAQWKKRRSQEMSCSSARMD